MRGKRSGNASLFAQSDGIDETPPVSSGAAISQAPFYCLVAGS